MRKLLFLCIIIPFLAFSQDSKKSTTNPALGFRLYHENDFFPNLSNNKDHNYTGGVKIELLTNVLSTVFRHSTKWKPLQQSISFNVTVFTPQNIADSNIIRSDRPYASYEYLGLGAAILRSNEKIKLSYEFSIGEFGRALAGQAQKYGHRKILHCFGKGRPEPKGWQYQVADGGAWAGNLKINHSHFFGRTNNTRKIPFVALWRNEVNVGQYMTNLSTGIRLMMLPKRFSPLIQGEPEISVPAIKRERARIYGYITPKVKGVLHNATLTGKCLNQSSVHKLISSNITRVLFEYDAGLQWNPGRWQIGYVLMGRGREFEQQVKKFHHWGGFYFGYLWQ